MNKVSIVIPAYNEEKRISGTLKAYSDYFKKLKEEEILDYEILVVINNTTDRTEEIVKNHQKVDDNVIYLDFVQGGKGFAVYEGFKDALTRDNDFIGFVDADLATPPNSFYELIKPLTKFDGTIANRVIKGSKTNYTWKRKVTSRVFNFIVRVILLVPFTDTQCGAKAFRRKAVEEIIKNEKISQWGFDVELLYRLHKQKYKIVQVPTIWFDRSGSKLDLKTVPLKMFSSVVRLRLIYSPFKFSIKLYDKLPERMKIHSL
jgi:glycosyltransferase involved in cell wall biosynthesis